MSAEDFNPDQYLATPTSDFNPDEYLSAKTDHIQAAIDSPKSITDYAKDIWTAATTAEQYNPEGALKRIGASGAIGAGIGLIGGVPGAVLGGAGGIIGGAAGEAASAMGANPLVRTAVEMVGSTVPNLAKTGITKALGLVSHKGRIAANLMLDSASETAKHTPEQAKLLRAMFGEDTYTGMYTSASSDAVQSTIKQELISNGIPLVANKKASYSILKNMYDNVKTLPDKSLKEASVTVPAVKTPLGEVRAPAYTKLVKTPNTFANSPEAAAFLTEDAEVLAKRLQVGTKDIIRIRQILQNELDDNPKVSGTAYEDLVNFIQNGGTYSTKTNETKRRITQEAQDALRSKFNIYLERNVGSAQYNELKAAQEAEFIAEARDSIPTILKSGFRYGKPEMEAAIANINKSPQGVADFKQAVGAHFNNYATNVSDDAVRMTAELSRLRPILEETKILSKPEIDGIYKTIQNLPKQLSKVKRDAFVKSLLTNVFAGTAGAEAGRALNKPHQNVFAL